MNWGLDSETQGTKFEEQTAGPPTPSSVTSPALAPEVFKQAVATPIRISAPSAAPSSPATRKSVRLGRSVESHAPAAPPAAIPAAPRTNQSFASRDPAAGPSTNFVVGFPGAEDPLDR